MKTIKLNSVYMHQGQKMSPKLVYGVDDAVADGLVGLGLAAYVKGEPDLTLDGMTWDKATKRQVGVKPDAMDQVMAAASTQRGGGPVVD